MNVTYTRDMNNRYINARTIKSAFIGGVGLTLIQLLFDRSDPLCFHWNCLRHYIGILIFGGLRSAWEYIKVPVDSSGEEVHTDGSKSAAAGR